jgi:hypothetical protein
MQTAFETTTAPIVKTTADHAGRRLSWHGDKISFIDGI